MIFSEDLERIFGKRKYTPLNEEQPVKKKTRKVKSETVTPDESSK